MLPIIRSDRADEDLIDIWNYIAASSPMAADRVLDAIEARWEQPALYPASGVSRVDIGPGIRHLTSGQYLTLYRVSAQSIEILRVIHGRRQIDRQLLE